MLTICGAKKSELFIPKRQLEREGEAFIAGCIENAA